MPEPTKKEIECPKCRARNDQEFKWDVFKHIDSIREGRTNFFLVAEEMMITAYMAFNQSEVTIPPAKPEACIVNRSKRS